MGTILHFLNQATQLNNLSSLREVTWKMGPLSACHCCEVDICFSFLELHGSELQISMWLTEFS